jgi:hypothetical protein
LTPAELLEAFLWVIQSDDPEDIRLRVEITQDLQSRGLDAFWAVARLLRENRAEWSVQGDDQAQQTQLALLDLVLSMDLPEVENFAYQLLTDNPSPQVTWRLGRYLQSISPGTYSSEIRSAAENALSNAVSFDDVPGELFQLLGDFGDASTVSLMVDMPWYRDAYASVALALIPDGSGLDLLIKDARLFEQGLTTTHGRLAIELLAQRAAQNPDAAQVLFDLAGQGLIPNDIWQNVLAAVAGQQSISLVRPANGVLAVMKILRPEGYQVLYRVTRSVRNEDPEQVAERDALVMLLRALVPPEAISG